MDWKKVYDEKKCTADEAVKCIKSGDWVDYGFALAQPVVVDEALAKRVDELEDIKIRSGITNIPKKVVEVDPEGKTFTYCDWHFQGYDRKKAGEGRPMFFIPLTYRNLAMHYKKNLETDVAIAMVTPMDEHGYFNVSMTNSATKSTLDSAKIVILEVNEKLPKVYGLMEESIHISEVDYVVEGDNTPPMTLPKAGEATEVDKKVAELVVEDIVNGSCIQLGIGGMPNAIGKFIAESDLKDLGIHTEMLVDAYLEMYKAGKITNKKKNIQKDKGLFGFGLGSQELYDWANENPGLLSGPTEYINDPNVMALNDNMISINNCIEVDLFGQTCAEAAGTRQITGSGGQLDFLTGSHMSKGGKGFICMSSSFKDKNGQLKSRIVPTMAPGSIVTDPRSQAYYIVTEYGKVNLAGRSTWEMAEMLISVAHPDFREDLIKEADKMGIWRKSNK